MNQYKYKKFKRIIRNIVKKYIPQYLDVLHTLKEEDYRLLMGNIIYWTKKFAMPKKIAILLRNTKIIEAISFWYGLFKSRAKVESKMLFNNEENYGNSLKNLKKVATLDNINITPNKIEDFSVIVPIGSNEYSLYKILKSSLENIISNQQISKIYLIFDGISELDFHINSNKIVYINNTKREGPARARNIGMNIVCKESNTNVILMDMDILAKKNSMKKFIESSSQLFGLISPKIYSYEKNWFGLYHNLMGTLNGRYLSISNKKELLYGTTSIMVVPYMIIEAGLRFDPRFSIAAGEDIDFCLRVRQSGFKIYALDNISMSHYYGYNNKLYDNIQMFAKRFKRYGEGEALLILKYHNYYKLLEKSFERISNSPLPKRIAKF
ncbi:MAG: glycosyltransferase [Promethearchaeota archaeon]